MNDTFTVPALLKKTPYASHVITFCDWDERERVYTLTCNMFTWTGNTKTGEETLVRSKDVRKKQKGI